MKILLIKQTSLGDVLHITPVIRAIKKCFENVEIDIVTDKRAVAILENNPYINKLYVLDIYRYERDLLKSPRLFFSTIREFIGHIKNVRKTKYDIAIDLQGLERSMIFLYFSHAKKKIAKGKWPFVESNYYKDINAISGLISFLSFIHCDSDGNKLDFFLPKDIDMLFESRLEKHNIKITKPYIVISPFSRWITKDLSIEKTREIIIEIKKYHDKQIIVSATDDYKAKCQKIVEGINNVIDLSGVLDIKTLAYLMKNAYACVSVDSFPMHLASSFETPLIALFGPTSEVRVGPLSKNSVVLRLENLDCKMCYRRKNCPNGYKCMRDLDSKSIALHIDKTFDIPVKFCQPKADWTSK